jgi:hypothetical protein
MNEVGFKFSLPTSLLVVVLTIIISLASYNFFYINEDFLKVNSGLLLTSLIAVLFAYFFNNRQLEERKKKDQIEGLLQKMQAMLSESFITKIQDVDDRAFNLMFQRSFDNKIGILQKTDLMENGNLKYVLDTFNEYRYFIGENHDDMEKLMSSTKTLLRLKNNIDDKLDLLILSLYK